MNINRDNYEMYFLMYVDNELSAAERSDVELFINSHPDLAEELELLAATTLNAEEHVFIPKTRLYKNATETESVQESLLLHLDNELSPEDSRIILSQISSNEQIEAEWEILQKTKLDPYTQVQFRDKKILYRYSGNVVRMRIWRVAAAILIGAGIFTGALVLNGDDKLDAVATNNDNIGVDRKNPILSNPLKTDKSLIADNSPVAEVKIKSEKGIAVNKTGNESVERSVPTLLKNINRDQSNQMVHQNVEEKEERLQKGSPELEVKAPEFIAESRHDEKINDVQKPLIDSEYPVARESFAKLASNEEGSEDRILYMEEDKVTRSKLGGIFRKVKRVVERNARINTSNGLRIGGFEIALK